jgi:DNA-binding transcriptional ArsR family regulator
MAVVNQPGRDVARDFGAVADVMRHLADPTRVKLLLALANQGEQNVAQLCQALAAPQPAVSHHLGILRRARLVRTRRQGREIHYRLDERASAAGAHGLRIAAGGATLLIETARRAAGRGAGIVVVTAALVALAI